MENLTLRLKTPACCNSTDRPRIGQVLHSLDRAGAEVLASDLARAYDHQYEFIFFCLDQIGSLGQALRQQGFKVHPLNRRPGLDLSLIRHLAAAGRKHHIDLWHAHQYTPFSYTAMARAYRGRSSLSQPILFTEHGRHYPDITSLRRRLANRWLLGREDRVTAVGQFVAEALVAHEAIPGSRITVIHNGIAPMLTNPDICARRNIRRKLSSDFTCNTPIVMQVARFHPVKDHTTALHAFAQVVSAMPAARFVLIGEGKQRQTAQQLAETLGIRHAVHFLGERTDVRKLLLAADVFLLSSLSEGISVTLLEAMAAGLPIVTTHVGGNPEVVLHDETGLLAPRRDAGLLAQHLLMLLQNPDTRYHMGTAGQRRFMQRFTSAAMHARYGELYRQMLNTTNATVDTAANTPEPPHPKSIASVPSPHFHASSVPAKAS